MCRHARTGPSISGPRRLNVVVQSMNDRLLPLSMLNMVAGRCDPHNAEHRRIRKTHDKLARYLEH
jgi:hypothetical protein